MSNVDLQKRGKREMKTQVPHNLKPLCVQLLFYSIVVYLSFQAKKLLLRAIF